MTLEARLSGEIDGEAGGQGTAPRQSAAKLDPLLVIMHGEASSPGRVGIELGRRGYSFDIRKPRFGSALPTSLAKHSGVIVFGGPMSCNDNDDYLKREIDFVGLALKEEKPYLGVCLGAQILAKALGATVGRHPAGKVEIGYYPLHPTQAGAVCGDWPGQVYHWHREGFELPSGCTRLAAGAVFENQAFCCHGNALGVQFHPEITYSMVNRWTTMAKDWTGKDGAQERDVQLRSHLLNAPVVQSWLDRLLNTWLARRLPA